MWFLDFFLQTFPNIFDVLPNLAKFFQYRLLGKVGFTKFLSRDFNTRAIIFQRAVMKL